MAQINFEHMQKNLTEVVEYLEYLEVLDVTEKNTDAQERTIVSQKIRRNPNQKS